MAKVIPIDIQTAKQITRGKVDFRETKYGVIAAKAKWPAKRKKIKKKVKIQNAKSRRLEEKISENIKTLNI